MAKKTVKKTPKKGRKNKQKNMSIESVVNKYPQTVDVFLKHGLHCIGCAVAAFENIEQGATVHGIDVKKLLDDLNKAIKKKK
ncbi:hybrid cluster protein-associated redox disulfide domain [Thermoplasmatales archaeon SCGC AB-539-C06]|nr:hybrid cluster protein-associated redox disulfide domain [Thermoplasmatales archaeon SCGC AB-539-C06]